MHTHDLFCCSDLNSKLMYMCSPACFLFMHITTVHHMHIVLHVCLLSVFSFMFIFSFIFCCCFSYASLLSLIPSPYTYWSIIDELTRTVLNKELSTGFLALDRKFPYLLWENTSKISFKCPFCFLLHFPLVLSWKGLNNPIAKQNNKWEKNSLHLLKEMTNKNPLHNYLFTYFSKVKKTNRKSFLSSKPWSSLPKFKRQNFMHHFWNQKSKRPS